MPELPEVETVARGLRELIVGKRILSAQLRGAKLKTQNPRTFSHQMKGKTVTHVSRRGKHLFIHLSGNLTLWCHLRMTGRFVEQVNGYKLDKHDHARFVFVAARTPDSSVSNDTNLSETALVFRDVRKFGFLRLVATAELFSLPEVSALGPEPLSIGQREFVKLFSARKRIIKPALLDQHLLAGIGNIYADEALFAAGIHPHLRCSDVGEDSLLALHTAVQRILTKAIARMGTTFDSYSGVNGQPGQFQRYLQVYGRAGEPCNQCGEPIIREVIAQRSAHYCGRCQKVI